MGKRIALGIQMTPASPGRAVLLLLLCGGCEFSTLPSGVGVPLLRSSFTGLVTTTIASEQGRTSTIVDDCDPNHLVQVRIGPRCTLWATWIGQPFVHSMDMDGGPYWREGAVAIIGDPSCSIEVAPGDAVSIRVERGTAIIAGDILQVSLDGTLKQAHRADPLGARVSVRVTGSLQRRTDNPMCSTSDGRGSQ